MPSNHLYLIVVVRIVDDQLNVVSCSSEKSLRIEAIPPKAEENNLTAELNELYFSLKDTQSIGHLIECFTTLNEGKSKQSTLEYDNSHQ